MIGIGGLSINGARSGVGRAARGVLNKFGTDAHVWLPGVGYLNGFAAANYIDSAGTQAGLVDNPVGRVNDAAGAITATQGTTANKPILRRGAVNLFPYGQTTQGAPSNRAAWIISQGYGGSGTPLNTTGSSAVSGAGIGYWEFTVNATAVATNRLLVDWGAINGAASTRQPVVAGATYTASMYIAVQGSITSSNNYVIPSILWYTSGNVFISQSSGVQVSASSTFGNTRLVVTGTAPATAAFAQIRADFSEGLVIGSVANATVQIGGAQLELGSTASEYIPTTTAAASSSSGNYYWQFDGSNDSLALSSVPFQMADDHCVVAGVKPNIVAGFGAVSVASSSSSFSKLAALSFSASGHYAKWTADGPTDYTTTPLFSYSGGNVYVSSARKVGSAGVHRVNGVQRGTISISGSATLNAGYIGLEGNGGGYFNGSIYPVIAIKGTVSDADLLTLEKWVGSLSGVSI